MKVQDIMSTNPSTVTPDSRLRDAARLMQTENVGVVPVVESNDSKRLVGILTDRDIAIRVVAEGRDAENTSVGQIMSANVKTCRATDDVDEVMDVMGKEQVRRVPIVDERGSLVGIVAQADIVLEARDNRKAEKTVEKISQPSGKHAQ